MLSPVISRLFLNEYTTRKSSREMFFIYQKMTGSVEALKIYLSVQVYKECKINAFKYTLIALQHFLSMILNPTPSLVNVILECLADTCCHVLLHLNNIIYASFSSRHGTLLSILQAFTILLSSSILSRVAASLFWQECLTSFFSWKMNYIRDM